MRFSAAGSPRPRRRPSPRPSSHGHEGTVGISFHVEGKERVAARVLDAGVDALTAMVFDGVVVGRKGMA
jgi:hypothetical protein